MDFYGGIYEHPPTQASIHVLPSKHNEREKPFSKAKRTWANILRIPGRQKKSRDSSVYEGNLPHSQNLYFTHPVNTTLPGYKIANQEYFSHQPQSNGSTAYEYNECVDYNDEDKKIINYKSLSRANGRQRNEYYSGIENEGITQKGNNTVKYTDWFGTVSRKKPLRPPLPAFHNPPNLHNNNNNNNNTDPSFSIWGNYINSYSVNNIQNFLPTIVTIQNPKICLCSDQIFSTRSKKHKKCKNCGRKFGTIRNKTVSESVTTIRPVIPPSFYHVPHPTSIPLTSSDQYAQPFPVPALNSSGTPFMSESEDESYPPTPDTICSNSSDRSEDSLISSDTIVEDNFQLFNTSRSSRSNIHSKQEGISPLHKLNGIYLEENSKPLDSSGRKSKITSDKKTNPTEVNTRNDILRKNHNGNIRDNLQELGGNSNTFKKIFIENSMGQKSVYGVIIEPKNEDTPNKFNNSLNYNIEGSEVNENTSSYRIPENINTSSTPSRSDNHRLNNLGSHSNKENLEFHSPERDSSNVVSIAGQQILLNHRKESYSFLPFEKELNISSNAINNPISNLVHSVKDWDTLQEYVSLKRNPNSDLQDKAKLNSMLYSSEYCIDKEKVVNDSNDEQNHARDIVDCESLDGSDSELNYIINDSDLLNDCSSSSISASSKKNEDVNALTEFSQVKSILKRPSSLDTSSETDSDFYFQTNGNEIQERLRKKKSVQFAQSQAKLESILLSQKQKDSANYNTKPNETVENNMNAEQNIKSLLDKNGKMQENGKEKSNSRTTEMQMKNKALICDDKFENTLSSAQFESSSTSSNRVRRSQSQRERIDTKESSFHDTYRLKQNVARPTILQNEEGSKIASYDKDSKIMQRRGNIPIRPCVPPPPPPSSVVKTLHVESPRSSPSPPPLPSTSPPPLPTSSSSLLHTSFSAEQNLNNEYLDFSSQKNGNSINSTLSITCINHRTQRVYPSKSPVRSWNSDHHLHISLDNTSLSPSIENNKVRNDTEAFLPFNSKSNRCFTLERMTTNTKYNHLSKYGFQNLRNSACNVDKSSQNYLKLSENPSRSLYPHGIMDENDADDERLSDHIYEELPSLPSTPCGKVPSFQEKSIFDGASKYEILEFLQDARSRVNIAQDIQEDNFCDIQTLPSESLNSDHCEDGNSLDERGSLSLQSRSIDERASNRSSNSGSSDSSNCLISSKERLKFGANIERTDSGVGLETSKPTAESTKDFSFNLDSPISSAALKGLAQHPCDDCDTLVEYKVASSGLMYSPLVCRRCSIRRQERKEILTEIIETEVKYGKDLTVIMEQFCRPMRIAGLLSPDQMDRIFLNIDKLIVHNRQFCLKLRDAYESALNQGDGDLLTVNVAKLFLHSTPMLHEFQNYCVRQGAASILLQNLEKEKELLRIFLKVSQMENTLLRRMNLHSFLMVPVQRVTKYPLLLARLYKSTPPSHTSREDCRRAREKIELYLQHINNETKDLSPTKLWRKISMSVSNNSPVKWSRSPYENNSTLRLRTVVLDILEWSTDDAYIVRDGRLLCLPPESNNWTRRGKTLRFANVKVVLVTLGKPRFHLKEKVREDGIITSFDLDIKEAAVLAFKDHRLTKTALIHEPWLLSRSVVTWDDEGESECFEVTDLSSKETFIFKDQGSVGTEEWFRSIQFHALSVGAWRRRRPALANIMINGARRN